MVVVRSSSTVVVVVDSIVGSWGLVPDPNPHSDGTIMPLQSSGMAQWYTLARTVSDVAEMWALFGLDGRATFLWVAASALMSFWMGNYNFNLPSNMDVSSTQRYSTVTEVLTLARVFSLRL